MTRDAAIAAFAKVLAAGITIARWRLGARWVRRSPPLYRVSLFLLTMLHHAGPIFMDLVVTPGVLGHFPSLDIAVAHRFLPLAAHTAFVALLREARRGESGNRKPQRKHCDHLFVQTNHASISANSPRAWVTRRRRKSSAARAALLQACVQCFEGTVTKLSSPYRARETPS